MSHQPERKEKDCLNCGTMVQGRYCHRCGQENIEPKETFWGMVYHFFSDITHFDGKFFSTIKVLFTRPGFLSAEYIRGRRKAYLHPIRMYVFTSAVFFLVFFSLFNPNDAFKIKNDQFLPQTTRDTLLNEALEDLEKDSLNPRLVAKVNLLRDTARFKQITLTDVLDFDDDFTAVGTFGGKYRDLNEYDSVQRALPENEKHNWLTRAWNKRAISINQKYKGDERLTLGKVSDLVLHKLPYVLFVSLPIFALILKLLYVRRREFYYADHGIFSIHHYILSFLLLLLVFVFSKMDDLTKWGIWDVLTLITILAASVYLYKGMRRFYQQSRLKTVTKFLLLNALGFITFLFIFLLFFIFSIFQL